MIRNLRTIGFNELSVFLQVVKSQGITNAATELGMAKSAVSSALSRFEERIGVKLLARSSRRISLTQEGEALLPRIASLVAEGERLLEQVEQKVAEPAGSVRIALTPDFGALMTRTFFPLVHLALPQINLLAKLGYQYEDLQDPSFDLAFRIGGPKDDGLVAKKLGEFRRVLVASPEFMDTHSINEPEQLAEVPCVLFSSQHTTRQWQLWPQQSTGSMKTVEVSGALSVFSFSAVADLAIAGLGVAYVPDFVAKQAIEAKRLVRVLPGFTSQPSEVFLCYRFGSDKISRVKAVIDKAKTWVPDLIAQARAIDQ